MKTRVKEEPYFFTFDRSNSISLVSVNSSCIMVDSILPSPLFLIPPKGANSSQQLVASLTLEESLTKCAKDTGRDASEDGIVGMWGHIFNCHFMLNSGLKSNRPASDEVKKIL